ncbi:TspO protein [Candidatus Kuenenbacteria bacterium RIFCSPLOWO2_12_FULL_42_13]|uniref:TspO protein n=1 Tax=Candidatus Kuenenbacteria bacterium RIFCSPLOWO2_12_FULL_42_13 TaxID=1798565 RepID=A0A1F6G2W3_9BACT|nr:MAG: TspO protein [Candidatus Kuenenbacteria bacterium RIFCSPLOWO2_12_FULL_42_13]
MKLNNFFKLVIAIGVSELAGIIGSVFTISAIPNWYAGLVKPALNPPAWVFGPAWTTLYTLMGIAAFLVWRMGWERKEVKMALEVFGIQLFLNAIWSIIFFGLQNPGWALVDIILLWLAIVWTMVVFYKISRPAAYLLVPYLLWVSFASYLNYSIWMLN